MWKAEEREIHLLDYWKVLVKRRWVFLALLAVTVFLVGLRTMLQRPVYTATVRLQVERHAPKVLPFQEVNAINDSYWPTLEFYETQYELIRSRRVARDVIASLRLARHPEFALAAPENLPDGIEPDAWVGGRRVDSLLGRLEVRPVAKSHLIDVSYSSFDRELAASVANRVAESYIAFNSEARYNTTERATASLAHQIANLQEDIEAKEHELQAYAREHGIVRLEDEQDIQMKKLRDLQVAYSRAQANRIEKEARYAALRDTAAEEIPEVSEGKLVQQLTVKSAELARRYAQLSEKYKPDWPEMVRLRTEIGENDNRLRRERDEIRTSVLGSAEGEYRAARNEEQALEAALEELGERIRELQLREIRYNQLQKEIENRRRTLDALVQRQTETRSSIGLGELVTGNIRIVDPAEVPSAASSPNFRLNLLVGLMLGMLLGTGTAFFLEYVDRSVKSAEDLQRAAGVACLGWVPEYHGAGRQLRAIRTARGGAVPEVELIAHADPKSSVAEAFREIRTSLLVSRPGGPPRALLVTSARPGEGKTVTALNLAITLAQSGRRVLLVDADLRRSRLHRVFGMKVEGGLTGILSSDGPVRLEAKSTKIPGLDLLPSGPVPPNPADLLDSERLDQLRREALAQGYDHVLFDGPPLLAVADPAILAGRVDAVILVARAGDTPQEALVHAVEKLRQVQAPLVGGILNQVDLSSAVYRSYGYKSYFADDADRAVSPPEDRTADGSGGRSA